MWVIGGLVGAYDIISAFMTDAYVQQQMLDQIAQNPMKAMSVTGDEYWWLYLATYLPVMVAFGLWGNSWRANNLLGRGFVHKGYVIAETKDMAITEWYEEDYVPRKISKKRKLN